MPDGGCGQATQQVELLLAIGQGKAARDGRQCIDQPARAPTRIWTRARAVDHRVDTSIPFTAVAMAIRFVRRQAPSLRARAVVLPNVTRARAIATNTPGRRVPSQ